MFNQEGGQNKHKPSLKEKVVSQSEKFLGVIYLWVLFALFAIHQSIILAEEHINYQGQGFAIVNALILAKVMLIGEAGGSLNYGDENTSPCSTKQEVVMLPHAVQKAISLRG